MNKEKEFGVNPEFVATVLKMRLEGQPIYTSRMASVQRILAINKGIAAQLQYYREKQAQDFEGQYCILAVPVIVKMEDADTDKVIGAGEYLSRHCQKLNGLQLGRTNDAYIVEVGEAVLSEMKW